MEKAKEIEAVVGRVRAGRAAVPGAIDGLQLMQEVHEEVFTVRVLFLL